MVSAQSVQDQLKRLQFDVRRWSRPEVKELPHILLDEEEIYECANGYYEGGFALLVATNFRVLLIDKKPLNYLTVEDLRFDMINEIDYSHRMFGAQITISTGSKTLRFRSYNQQRLRKLINHVQHCMASAKQQLSQHAEGQNQHLERINQQLQTYLMAQLKHQQELTKQLQLSQQSNSAVPAALADKPNPELADYLYAQSLLRQYEEVTGKSVEDLLAEQSPATPTAPTASPASPSELPEMYADAKQEIFGKYQQAQAATAPSLVGQPVPAPDLEVNPLRIAYSKLPMALRHRKFGRPTVRVAAPVAQVQQPSTT